MNGLSPDVWVAIVWSVGLILASVGWAYRDARHARHNVPLESYDMFGDPR